MYAVIFEATIKQLDDTYAETAKLMRDLALTEFGCTGFSAVTEGDKEIAISYWPSLAHIAKWKNHSPHLDAQKQGKSFWYESYSVKVVEILRSY